MTIVIINVSQVLATPASKWQPPALLAMDDSGRIKFPELPSSDPTAGNLARMKRQPESFEVGQFRFSRTSRRMVVNQSPHVPFRADDERSAFSFLFLHQVWPNGEESQILEPSETAVQKLLRLRTSHLLSPSLVKLIERQEGIQASLDTQGIPMPSFDEGRVIDQDLLSEHGSESSNELSFDSEDEVDLTGLCADTNALHSETRIGLPTLSFASSFTNGLKILNKVESQSARYYMNALVHETAEHHAQQNAFTDAEQMINPNLRSRFPYQNNAQLVQERDALLVKLNNAPLQIAGFKRFQSHIKGENEKQLLTIMSGEGGVGKTEVIKATVLEAKIVYGKTGGFFGPVVVVAPTGAAACNVGGNFSQLKKFIFKFHCCFSRSLKCFLVVGYTWQSAFCVGVQKTTSISQALSNKLQLRFKGVKLLIFDEFSMLDPSDLYDMHKRCQSAQSDASLKHLPFGGKGLLTTSAISFVFCTEPFDTAAGFHVMFCGDFCQLPPVGGGNALFVPNAPLHQGLGDDASHEPNKKIRSVLGRDLWCQFSSFLELTENFRWTHKAGVLATVAPLARCGLPIPPRLLDQLNKNVVLTPAEANEKFPGAKWCAPTNAECASINQQQLGLLVQNGALKMNLFAYHTPGRRSTLQAPSLKQRTKLLATVPNKKDLPHGRGCGLNVLTLCMGARVRASRNICTQAKIYQGAPGTVVGTSSYHNNHHIFNVHSFQVFTSTSRFV